MRLSRRSFVQGLALAPLAACSRPPETPLAHLHGQNWVAGVYEMHAKRYLDVQMGAETSSHGAYRALAQRGIGALGGLQSRDVPFLMRLNDAGNSVQIDRRIPERLTFTPEMSAEDRKHAEENWHRVRQHVHTDYFEINRLNWALTTLLRQLLAIHGAMEQAEIEQFKIVRDLAELRDGKATPYQLPQNVTRGNYLDVLLLLLGRLEDDLHRLAAIEASIAAVGLTARSTDAGSGSLAANLNKVMLSVIRDAEATTPKPAVYPQQATSRSERLAEAKKLAAEIEASPEYFAWKKQEEAKALEQVGMLFEAIDAVTHLPTSALFRAVITIWRGDGDYLAYLKTLATIVPGGGRVAKTISSGIETSERVRSVIQRVRKARARGPRETARETAADAVLEEAKALLNTESRFGRARLDKQLAFFEDEKELEDVKAEVATTELLRAPMPEVPQSAPPPSP